MNPSPATGGCQCGAVRYSIEGPLKGAHFCHCRMCQRAVGNVFAALVAAPKDAVTWTRGAPTIFASSDKATRGFCATCGTPLTFAYNHSHHLNVTIGSLDEPKAWPIEMHYGVEGRLPWVKVCDGLPEEATSDEAGAVLADMISHQAETR